MRNNDIVLDGCFDGGSFRVGLDLCPSNGLTSVRVEVDRGSSLDVLYLSRDNAKLFAEALSEVACRIPRESCDEVDGFCYWR